MKELPELAMLGDEGFEGEAAEVQLECSIAPCEPGAEIAEGSIVPFEPGAEIAEDQPSWLDEDPSWLDDSWFSDEEVLEFEKESKGALPPDQDAFYNPEASSASGKLPMGHFATPNEIRHMIPPGSRIQHRRAKSEKYCSGWQAWPGPHEPSRFFSYGKHGKFSDRENALQAAVAFCWGSKPK